jgi:hypothetical protein
MTTFTHFIPGLGWIDRLDNPGVKSQILVVLLCVDGQLRLGQTEHLTGLKIDKR